MFNLKKLIIFFFVTIFTTLVNARELKYIYSDIALFYKVFDQVVKLKDKQAKIELIQKGYIDSGTKELRIFVRRKKLTAERYLKEIELHRSYFEEIRPNAKYIEDFEKRAKAIIANFKTIYPQFKPPTVVFLMGCFTAGGTAMGKKLFISMEMNCKNEDSDISKFSNWLQAVLNSVSNLPSIFTHELVHTQQKVSFGMFRLLGNAIQEGAADFVSCELLGIQMKTKYFQYGLQNEKALWQEFKKEMRGKDKSNWLYQGNRSKNRPADLGYFIGYKICESFYKKMNDPKKAFRKIIRLKKYRRFLRKSGYELKWK